MKLPLLFLCFLGVFIKGQAQSPPLLHVWDNALDLIYLKNDRWELSGSLDNRAVIEFIQNTDDPDDTETDLDFDFIELKHDAAYKLSEAITTGLEFRLRYRRLFDIQKDNELRIAPYVMQVFETGIGEAFGEFRLEQRNYSEATAYRIKLSSGLEWDLSQEAERPVTFGSELMGTFQYEQAETPAYGLRIGGKFGFPLGPKIKIEAGLQVRFDELGPATERELFYRTGVVYRWKAEEE